MSDLSWTTYLLERLPELWQRLGEHIFLTGVSTFTGVLIGVPLGIWAYFRPGTGRLLLASAGILQTIPSLAMLVILLALFQQIGVLPAITALVLYALLPVLRNTVTGLQGVAPEILEAADGMGMTAFQKMRDVQIPLALPTILAGVRTAAVVGVGIATLAAFIGAGGLGEFINRGLALSNTRLICLGAIPAALLALLVDAFLGAVEKFFNPRQQRAMSIQQRRVWKTGLVLMAGLFIMTGLPGSSFEKGSSGKRVIRIGSKNFTEQNILGELMAQLIEARTQLSVERKFNLGGTLICHNALVQGDIDLYAEYTGTAMMAILNQGPLKDASGLTERIRHEYQKRFDLVWLKPFGFNNTYTITVRQSDARKNGWRTISDLNPFAPKLTAGFSPEFQERSDGYPGFKIAYGFQFGQVQDLDPSLIYRAIAEGAVDLIVGFSTDGRIPAYNLKSLKDDADFFPPYFAGPVIRRDTLTRFPHLKKVVSLLESRIDDATMMDLNFQVDEKKRDVPDVVQQFLKREKLI